MKTNSILFLIFSACAFVWHSSTLAEDYQMEAMKNVRQVMASVDKVDSEELKSMIDTKKDFVLLDLRTPDEIRNEGKIDAPQQLEIPRGSLETQIFQKVVDKDTPIVAYCGAGFRSALAVKTLEDMGFTNVVNYEEGFMTWKISGYPITSEAEAKGNPKTESK
jgi:rhodanese-related sulfurtransferase